MQLVKHARCVCQTGEGNQDQEDRLRTRIFADCTFCVLCTEIMSTFRALIIQELCFRLYLPTANEVGF